MLTAEIPTLKKVKSFKDVHSYFIHRNNAFKMMWNTFYFNVNLNPGVGKLICDALFGIPWSPSHIYPPNHSTTNLTDVTAHSIVKTGVICWKRKDLMTFSLTGGHFTEFAHFVLLPIKTSLCVVSWITAKEGKQTITATYRKEPKEAVWELGHRGVTPLTLWWRLLLKMGQPYFGFLMKTCSVSCGHWEKAESKTQHFNLLIDTWFPCLGCHHIHPVDNKISIIFLYGIYIMVCHIVFWFWHWQNETHFKCAFVGGTNGQQHTKKSYVRFGLLGIFTYQDYGN